MKHPALVDAQPLVEGHDAGRVDPVNVVVAPLAVVVLVRVFVV